MRKLLCLASFATAALSACVTVPNTEGCSVAGSLARGMICAETLTDKKRDLDLDHTIEFLEPQEERPDPEHPGATLPARAGAVCRSAEDDQKIHTALEQACRQLGKACSYEVQRAIKVTGVAQP